MSNREFLGDWVPALTRARDGVYVRVKVNPRSHVEQIVDLVSDRIRVKLTAPPVGGEANRALVKLVSRACGVSRVDVEIVAGEHSSQKTLLIRGLEVPEVARRLERSIVNDRPTKKRKKGGESLSGDPS